MESTADVMQSIFDKLIKNGRIQQFDPCPTCGSTMSAFVNPQTNKPRSMPACPQCGYKVTNGKVATNEEMAVKWEQQANKHAAISYLTHASVITDNEILDKTLDNFKIADAKTKEAKQVAAKIIDDFLDGEPVHGIFSGSTGTGKTHLAMGILYEILIQSDYKKRCLFVDFRELINQMKLGFNDKEAFKRYNQSVIAEIKQADIVVIDDIGSEAGDDVDNYSASQYNLDVATTLFQSRVNQATIVTTNRTGSDLKSIYGSRVVSRIMAHTKDHIMRFDNMKDWRLIA